MAFTYDTKSPSSPSSSTSAVTQAHTCATNTGVLVVTIQVTGVFPRTGGAPTYNSLPLSPVSKPHSHSGGEGYMEVWYLLSPPTGSSYNIYVPNDDSHEVVVQGSSYTVASGKVVIVESTFLAWSTAGSANPSATAVVGTSGDLVVAGLFSGYANITAAPMSVSTSGGVELYEYDSGSEVSGAQYLITSASGDTTISWVQTSDDWVIKGAVFKEVDSGTAAIQLVGAATSHVSGVGTALSLTHLLDIDANDVIVAICAVNGSGTLSDNNGSYSFTEVIDEANPATGAGSHYAIYTRVAGASEPSSYAFTSSNSDYWSVIILQFRGVDTSNIWDVTPSTSTRDASTSDGTTATNDNAISTSYDNSLALAISITDNQNNLYYQSIDNGFWGLINSGDDYQSVPQSCVAFKHMPTAGSIGTTNITQEAANDWCFHKVALRRASSSRTISHASTFATMTAASAATVLNPRTISHASIFASMTCAANATNVPPARTISHASIFASMTCAAQVETTHYAQVASMFDALEAAISASNTPPARTASHASVFEVMTCVANATNVPPARTISHASIFATMACAAEATSGATPRTAEVASTFASMTCSAQATNTPPARTISHASVFSSMTCAAEATNLSPARTISHASLFEAMTCAAASTNTPPARTISHASLFQVMTCEAQATSGAPPRTASVASAFASMTCAAASTNVPPARTISHASIFSSMLCSIEAFTGVLEAPEWCTAEVLYHGADDWDRKIRWAPVTGAERYYLEYKVDSGSWQVLDTVEV